LIGDDLRSDAAVDIMSSQVGARTARRGRVFGSDWSIRLLAFIGLLAAWQILAEILGPLFLPSPARTLEAFTDLIRDGELLDAWLETFWILGIGLGAIVVVGVSLGLLLGRFRLADVFLDPVLTGLFIVPKLALLPIVVLWLGFQEPAKILYIFLFGVLDVFFVVRNGVRAIEADYVEVARSYVVPEKQLLRSIILPATLPFIVTGLRLGLLKGIEGAIIAGFFLEANGIGGLVFRSGANFRPDIVFAGLATVAVVGISINVGLHAAERRLAPWAHGRTV
jgi:NitT/TauT family transport system permease protein